LLLSDKSDGHMVFDSDLLAACYRQVANLLAIFVSNKLATNCQSDSVSSTDENYLYW